MNKQPASDDPVPSAQSDWPDLPRLTEQQLHERRETVFLILSGLFLGTLAMLNILGISRFIDLSFTLPGTSLEVPVFLAVGVLPYPVTFLCTDFISEIYGPSRASRTVWMGLILNLWVMFILWLGAVLPGVEKTEGDDLFQQVQKLAMAAVFASMVSYLLAQFVDVHLFHWLKKRTGGRFLWLRNNGSTITSQLVDTTSVILVTHAVGGLPVDPQSPILPQLIQYIVSGYGFKVAVALFDTVPFYLGTRWLRRYLRLPNRGS